MASCDAPQRRQARLPPSLKTNGDVCVVLRLERKDQMSRSGASAPISGVVKGIQIVRAKSTHVVSTQCWYPSLPGIPDPAVEHSVTG